jgi:hypothetical protein
VAIPASVAGVTAAPSVTPEATMAMVRSGPSMRAASPNTVINVTASIAPEMPPPGTPSHKNKAEPQAPIATVVNCRVSGGLRKASVEIVVMAQRFS